MAVVESDNAKISALSAKLALIRTDVGAKDRELNDLRNKVVALEDASPVAELKAQVASLSAALSDAEAKVADLTKQVEKAGRDLAAAGPALDLAAAVAAVR